MGEAVFLFAWLVSKQTKPNGLVLGGHHFTYDEITSETGWPRRTLQRWMARLQLHHYVEVKHTSYCRMIIRILNPKKRFKVHQLELPVASAPQLAHSKGATSGARGAPNVAHLGTKSGALKHRDLVGSDTTRRSDGPDVPVAGKVGRDKSSSSCKNDDDSALQPDWEPIESKIKTRMLEAKNALLGKGWPPHVVDAALHFIEERSDYSGTVPASAQYFLVAFDHAMADARDKAAIIKRAERRARVMPPESALRSAAKELLRESEASGQSIKEHLARRAAGGT